MIHCKDCKHWDGYSPRVPHWGICLVLGNEKMNSVTADKPNISYYEVMTGTHSHFGCVRGEKK